MLANCKQNFVEQIPKQHKTTAFKVYFKPVLKFDCETRTLNKRTKSEIQEVDTCLRIIEEGEKERRN